MAKNTLSIYACSGIGSSANIPEGGYDYWLDETKTISNTQAVNQLLLNINMLASDIQYSDMSDEDVLTALNDIDLYSTVLYFVKQYQNDANMLIQAGRAIGKAYDNGLFIFADYDNSKRDLHLDEVIGKVSEYMDDSDIQEASEEWQSWWNDNISLKNKVYLTTEQQAAVQESLEKSSSEKISGSYKDNKELANYIDNSGEYFLYCYATEDQLKKLPSLYRKKRDWQMRLFEECRQMYDGVYGAPGSYADLIRISIRKQLNSEPEKKIKLIVDGYNINGVRGVGDIVAIIGAIVALITAITALLKPVLNAVVASYNAKTAAEVTEQKKIDVETIKINQANKEDFDNMAALYDENEALKKKQKLIPIIAAAVGLVLLMKNK